MVFAEIGCLSEKQRIDSNLEDVQSYIKKHRMVNEAPLLVSTILVAFEIHDIPELHDRLIAATSVQNNFIIITNDPSIRNSKGVTSVWD
ncbi:MAG: PIN domain nuclease of toxin-antitoxin system [Flavobacteriales bacterium]|jgi:PIN domain nuclease of toxin-antitoxin system